MLWLGESLLGVVIKKSEVRVLHTGEFNPGVYREPQARSFADDTSETDGGSIASMFKLDLGYQRQMTIERD